MLTDTDLEKFGRIVEIKLEKRLRPLEKRISQLEERVSQMELAISEIRSDINAIFLHLDQRISKLENLNS